MSDNLSEPDSSKATTNRRTHNPPAPRQITKSYAHQFDHKPVVTDLAEVKIEVKEHKTHTPLLTVSFLDLLLASIAPTTNEWLSSPV